MMEFGGLKTRLLTSVIAQIKFPLGEKLEVILSWIRHFPGLGALDWSPGCYRFFNAYFERANAVDF
jgi:hypothetical protein